MNVTMTAKLKLHPTPQQFQALRQTQLAYLDALNYVTHYSFAHGKKSNQQWLQRECYDELRLRFGLPAQMACNVPRQVGATYKGLLADLVAILSSFTTQRYGQWRAKRKTASIVPALEAEDATR